MTCFKYHISQPYKKPAVYKCECGKWVLESSRDIHLKIWHEEGKDEQTVQGV